MNNLCLLYVERKNMNYHQSVMNFFINHEIHEKARKDSTGGFANPARTYLRGGVNGRYGEETPYMVVSTTLHRHSCRSIA